MNRLQDRVAFVSGGARGIGEAIVRAFHAEGAKVVVADVRVDQATVVAESLGDRAMALALDVTDETSWRESIAAAVARFGSLDVMVNNAGVAEGGPIAETTLDSWQRVIDVNQTGVFLGLRAAIETIRSQRPGSSPSPRPPRPRCPSSVCGSMPCVPATPTLRSSPTIPK